jgi:hypothetical protein
MIQNKGDRDGRPYKIIPIIIQYSLSRNRIHSIMVKIYG